MCAGKRRNHFRIILFPLQSYIYDLNHEGIDSWSAAAIQAMTNYVFHFVLCVVFNFVNEFISPTNQIIK